MKLIHSDAASESSAMFEIRAKASLFSVEKKYKLAEVIAALHAVLGLQRDLMLSDRLLYN